MRVLFGYVKVFPPDLTLRDYEQYRGVYCSLCKEMGHRYGPFPRLTLSYDMTFLALLYLALDTECTAFSACRCLLHPTRRRACCRHNQQIIRCADLAVLLAYYKTVDAVRDSHFLKKCGARIYQGLLFFPHRKAARLQPEAEAWIADYMAAQQALEQAHTASPDQAAEPTAVMMTHLAALAAHSDEERRILERLGYCLGRWIYLMDAVDDVEEDAKSGSYNPFVPQGRAANIQALRDNTRPTLNGTLAECLTAYQLLSVKRFDTLLTNALTRGMPHRQQEVISGQKKPSAGGIINERPL